MYGFNRIVWLFPIWLLISTPCLGEEDQIVDHHDPITIDPNLSLAELVNNTLEKYPDISLIPALQQEADALQRRGNSWLAGALNIALYFNDDGMADDVGARELEGAVELPLWNWGQREAGQQVAERAKRAGTFREQAIKLTVTELVRLTLWDMALENNHYEMSKQVYDVSEKLVNTVKRRVELGDLPRADLLLAQIELLENRSKLINAEAEKMHARKRFTTLTQSTHIPADFNELQSRIDEINTEHPALNLINAIIERKQSELEWVKSAGSGQTIVALGAKSERGSRDGKDIETMTFSLSVPFGGGAHLAPEIAVTNLELTEAIAERGRRYRELEKNLHEAKHALEVDQAELEIAQERKKISEAHLKMTRLSFSAGEINLLDLLKIQSRAYDAIGDAKERAIMQQRDIALYNQAVGVMP